MALRPSSLTKPAFGTYKIFDPQVIQNALLAGYRHLDSATGYRNHQAIAEGIQKSGIPRDELFLASKLNHENITSIKEAAETIVKDLQTDYLDLLYLHTPDLATYQVLEILDTLRQTGLVREVGISNIDVGLLSSIIETGYTLNAVQVEIHPYFWREELIQTCRSHQITVYGYRPLGGGKNDLLQNPVINEIADDHNKSPSQIILKWLIEKGVTPIVKSQDSCRQQENLDLWPLRLTSSEIQAIDSLKTVDQPTCHWQKKCHFTMLSGIGSSSNG